MKSGVTDIGGLSGGSCTCPTLKVFRRECGNLIHDEAATLALAVRGELLSVRLALSLRAGQPAPAIDPRVVGDEQAW